MKKILFSILAMALVLSSCGTKSYDEKLSKGFEMSEVLTGLSAVVCSETASTWHTAIYDDRDSHGKYCSDFNDALRTLHNDFEELGILDKITDKKSELDVIAKELVKCPKSRKDAYDDFIELVTDVNAFADLAVDPEGSLTSYNSATKDLAARIKKQIDAFELKYGDFLVEISIEEDTEDDW